MRSLSMLLCSSAMAIAVVSPVSAGARPGKAFYDYAAVERVTPITEVVRVETPRQECWTESRTRLGYRGGAQTYTPEIVGVIIGAAIGNRFGDGRGRDLATAAGAVLGGSIGHDVKRRRQSYAYAEPVEHCEVRHEYYDEGRVVGYGVIYRYQGRTYHTRSNHDPGEHLRVRVRVEPVE